MTEIDYTKWEYPETTLKVVEEFNGYVSSIEEDSFYITFKDMDGDDLQSELMMTFLDDECTEEKPWLNEGQYFRWRFMESPDNPSVILDEFVFYKQTYSEEDINQINKKAHETWLFLNGKTDDEN